MFEEIKNETINEREERILREWRENQIFQKSLELRKNCPYFSFYDGPPFATGLPHYGHLLAGTIKDVIPRYKTMKGYFVPRRFGWDCHGLPIENEIEKTFQLSGAPSIEEFGIAKFNEECRKIVQRYTKEWESKVERMGRWVDFKMTWKTMDLSFMETVWWVFKQLYEKGLIYEGLKVMPFSAKLGTPLSNFEASENYKEIDDPSIVVTLPLEENPDVSLLVWTTTPWTLVSNLAASVGPDIKYVFIRILSDERKFILAKATLPKWFPDETSYVIEQEFLGKELVGKHYCPVFHYFAQLKEKGAFRIIEADFVSTDEGTGIVHTAPAFGETDFYASQQANIPLVCPVDNNGRFTSEIPEYSGLFVKEADPFIMQRLKKENRLFYKSVIRHRYPFCWRSDTPLIYKAITTWFVRVEKIKEDLIAANQKTHWTPEHLKAGRFGNWLEGARDWAISRNRYWGTPIPIWRGEKGEIVVLGSIAELEERTGAKITDLHRHFIDHLTFEINGNTYNRVTEVFDCWFDAGSMPYAQNHYPFENKELTEKTFPADFVAEGIDQTRGWFYTLMILSTALFNQPPFKNVITNGIILAEDGNKMSKRLKNYPDPDVIIQKYGADAVRLYLLNSAAVKAEDLRFSERGVELTLRQMLIPFWNAHLFFITYAKIYHWHPANFALQPRALLDKWILAQLQRLIFEVEQGMDTYDLSKAVDPFVGFIDQLTNWYIRRSRRRFWQDEDTQDRREAFATLYFVLINLSKIAAPFIPFSSEAIYKNLKTSAMEDSVHLCDYPTYKVEMRNPILEKGMEALQTCVSLGHSLRKENKLKVRQPLSKAHVVCEDKELLKFLSHEAHLIADELNVKEILFYQESHEFVKIAIKPNFRVLGKKVGKHMKEAQFFIQQLSQEEVKSLFQGRAILMILSGEKFVLTPDDVEVTRKVHEGWVAMNAGEITIALETELNEALILEGIARELVNKINSMRRDADFAVTDRIFVHIGSTNKVHTALAEHYKYISEEVLALEIKEGLIQKGTHWDINGEPTAIYIEKALL